MNTEGGSATSTGRITPPLKWHADGGKHYLAPRIVAMMPPHTHYVEPYFGGGAVLLAKDPEGVSEVANDLNQDLSNFWDVLRDPGLYHPFRAMCQSTPFCESTWRDAAEPRGPYPDACGRVRAAWVFFVRCRQSLAGRMKSFAPPSRTRTRRGMNEQVAAWLTAVEGLPAVHERLKRVYVYNRDALDVIRSEDGPQTMFYLDPPYLDSTRAAPDVYKHEATPEHHVELLDLVNRAKGKVMLSGYRSHLYEDQLRSGWRRVDFDCPNNAAGGKAKRRMTESLWCNF